MRGLSNLALVLSALCVMVASCGAGGPVEPARLLSARVGACDVPAERLHDSGAVVYLVVAADCNPGFPATVQVTVQPERGAGPVQTTLLFAGFTDQKDVSLEGLGARRLGVVHQGQWRSFPNTDSWAARDGAGLLSLDGKLYLLGGWLHGPVSSEVWVTSDLAHWTFLGNAPWEGRHGSAWLVHDRRLWVIGGDLIDDVWSSPDGVHWTLEVAHAPFGKRYTPNAVSLNGSIYLYAGQYWDPVDWCIRRPDCKAIGLNDVWKSGDGRNWSLVNPAAPWSPRGLVHGSIVWHDQIYVIGGGLKGSEPYASFNETIAEFGDVWSSPDGVQWQERVRHLSFPLRTHFSVLAAPFGCVVSDGSVARQTDVSNDLYIATDCEHFKRIDQTPQQPRHASSLVYFNGSLVLLGGPPVGSAGTEVWQYFP